MKSPWWQQLDQLFHSAIEHGPEERAAFLNDACKRDEALRKEVERLIAAHEDAGNFIEAPALEVEARELAADSFKAGTLAVGETVSHYRVVSMLGSGGMGEVYLAEDTVLNRQVALKLLPEYFASDRERLRRFQQEARTASALNHPNIITIFETGELDGRHFIVTEFIDGATLRQSLCGPAPTWSSGQSRLREVIDIAIQTADALAAAHEAGIVHRDIKPENIMLRRRDGYVKVLDFGLAKLTEGPSVDEQTKIKTQDQTSAGMLMGTTRYMSPEQLRGEKVDARTDIWSLGVVLYEMVAGRAPFERATASEVIALILEREPPPLAECARDVPAELERIVKKALTKDREGRYDTVKNVLVDLRRLKQRLEIAAEMERTGQPRARADGTTRIQTAVATEGTATIQASPLAPTISSFEPPAGKIEWPMRSALLLGLIVLAIGAGAYAVNKLTRIRDTPQQAFHRGQWSRLTTTGQVTLATISPDGKYVAHTVDHAGQQSLRLRQVATTSDKEIIAPASIRYRGLTFSPDGNYIYYIASTPDTPQLALYQIATLGGEMKKLLVGLAGDIDHGVRATVRFSPDGKQITFLRQEVGKDTALMVANADGTGERKITAYPPVEGIGFPAWSPDGNRIAYVVLNFHTNQSTVVEAQVAGGARRPMTSHQWRRIFGLEWLSDGSGLLMVAGQRNFISQIWQLSFPGGEPHQLTNDLHDYVGISLAADANILGVIKFERHAAVWVVPDDDVSRARPVTSGAGVSADQLAFSPEGGKIVFRSNASGNSDVWVVGAEGGSPRQLTAGAGINNFPVVSPDGRSIVFLSDRSGVPHIWKMNIDGSEQKQLTNGSGEQCPEFSPDGRWVLYSTVASKSTIWKMPAEGGEPVQLSDKDAAFASVSPDGKLVAYAYKDEKYPWRMAIAPFEGGQPLKTFDLGEPRNPLHWTPDGRAVAYIDTRNGVSNILAQSLDGGDPEKLTDFKTDRIFWFDWSADGRQLALSRGTMTRDVVMISNFR